MAENKTYTLESAKELFSGESWDTEVANMSLDEMKSLDSAIYGQPISENIADESMFIRQEALKRIEAMASDPDAFNPDDLGSIEEFVKQFASNSINGESIYASDAARAVMDKVAKQKLEAESKAAMKEEATQTVEDTAEPQEFAFGDESKENSENENTPNPEEPNLEEEAEIEAEPEEATFPEGEPAKAMSEEEFAQMMDPLGEKMPNMDSKEILRQQDRLEKVMALSEEKPYHPEYSIDNSEEYAKGEESVGKTIDLSVEQSAIRDLTISNEEITAESLEAARESQSERINTEYFNAIFGVCKSSEELDKETPNQQVERLGKVADLISKKRPKEEIYAAMGVKPTKEQESQAASAVYQTNAEPAKNWAKKLGKAGAKYLDNYRAFEKDNPMMSMALSTALSGTVMGPIYKGARMVISARGLYKDYQGYKEKHPGEKVSFIGMLKDKETRKSLKANAGIFIRSVPVIGTAYGIYGMAEQLKNTCKKSFFKDLGSKFKEAGAAIKEVAKDPKDWGKWKDMGKKIQKPAAIVGGVALTAFAAYKMTDGYVASQEQPDNSVDGITGAAAKVAPTVSLDDQMAADGANLDAMGVNPAMTENLGPDALHQAAIHREVELESMGLGKDEPINGGTLDEVVITAKAPEPVLEPELEPIAPKIDPNSLKMEPAGLNVEEPVVDLDAMNSLRTHSFMTSDGEVYQYQIDREGNPVITGDLNGNPEIYNELNANLQNRAENGDYMTSGEKAWAERNNLELKEPVATELSPEDQAYIDSLREPWTLHEAQVAESPLQDKPITAPVYEGHSETPSDNNDNEPIDKEVVDNYRNEAEKQGLEEGSKEYDEFMDRKIHNHEAQTDIDNALKDHNKEQVSEAEAKEPLISREFKLDNGQTEMETHFKDGSYEVAQSQEDGGKVVSQYSEDKELLTKSAINAENKVVATAEYDPDSPTPRVAKTTEYEDDGSVVTKEYGKDDSITTTTQSNDGTIHQETRDAAGNVVKEPEPEQPKEKIEDKETQPQAKVEEKETQPQAKVEEKETQPQEKGEEKPVEEKEQGNKEKQAPEAGNNLGKENIAEAEAKIKSELGGNFSHNTKHYTDGSTFDKYATQDGVTEITKYPDGHSIMKEYERDGSVKTTGFKPDGSKEVVEADKFGQKTVTKTDEHGNSKTTTPEENGTAKTPEEQKAYQDEMEARAQANLKRYNDINKEVGRPKLVELNGRKTYEFLGSHCRNSGVLEMQAQEKVLLFCKTEEKYQEIDQKVAAGENLTDKEQALHKSHEALAQRLGLEKDADGNWKNHENAAKSHQAADLQSDKQEYQSLINKKENDELDKEEKARLKEVEKELRKDHGLSKSELKELRAGAASKPSATQQTTLNINTIGKGKEKS